MRKRIFLPFAGLLVLCACCAALLCGYIFSRQNGSASFLDGVKLFCPAALTAAALFVFLAFYISKRLALKFAGHMEGLDFENGQSPVYKELLPFAKKIINGRREADAKIAGLQDRAATVEAVIGSMKEGLILLDSTGLILSANRSANGIFGGKDLARQKILHVCRDILFQHGVKECVAGRSATVDFERGGRVYEVFFNPARDSAGVRSGAVILFLDVTERFEAEKQRREFSANVSHELKTPLTTIRALAEMIETGMAKGEDVQAFAGKLLKQATRLTAITNDIIRLSEFDEQRPRGDRSEFDLYGMAESVAESLREKAEGKKVAIHLEGERPCPVVSVRSMADELLYNLLDNAIKYNKENGSVTVSVAAAEDSWTVEVADTGIGIPPEHQGRIFERFYRVDASRSKNTGGTGLGLSIVKHIAEHLGGTVQLTSVEGEGTAVRCVFQ
ncbi:MAG: two-component sensor histidine kinase [Clostridiales bacterium]|jgi:two-component system phosphate regulon sensor histidine kinase PhoR|nr:two-component sensor histidine kinase [Clostridiales bacterium]